MDPIRRKKYSSSSRRKIRKYRGLNVTYHHKSAVLF